MPEHVDPAAIDGQQRADEPDERALPRAVGTEHAVDLAFADRHAHVVHGQDRLLLAADHESLRGVVDEQRRQLAWRRRSDAPSSLGRQSRGRLWLGGRHRCRLRFGRHDLGHRSRFLLRGIKKPWCRSGPRFVVSASAALPPCVYLDQGTDLPSTSLPIGASRCVMKAPVRCIAVRSLLGSGGWWPDTAGQRRLRRWCRRSLRPPSERCQGNYVVCPTRAASASMVDDRHLRAYRGETE